MAVDVYSFQSVHRPNNQSIAQKAFNTVKDHFNKSSGLTDPERQLIADSSRFEDVQEVVAQSIHKYNAKSQSSGTRQWLHKASETICHYGQVLDVFVQHHPEYVSLVWGTMKLLFTSVVNHAETLKLLAKSICQVGERLPRINLLSELYPTHEMQNAVESLYSCILEFLLMAHGWCNESKFRHMYHSFTQPHQLRYSELLERIADRSNNILEIASTGSQVKIHAIHSSQTKQLSDIIASLEAADKDRENQLSAITSLALRMEATNKERDQKIELVIALLERSGIGVNDLVTKTESFHAIQTSAQLDTNQHLSDLQLSQVLSTFSLKYEDATGCYRSHLVLRNRRASGIGSRSSTNNFWMSPKLAKWSSSSSKSSLVVIKGTYTSRWALVDFGIDMITTLARSTVPTLWALQDVSKPRSDAMCSTTDLLKYLTYQVLLKSGSNLTEKKLTLRYSQFHTAQTPKEWLDIFKKCLSNLNGQVYVIVDLAILDPQKEFNLVQGLGEMLADLSAQDPCPHVKIVLLDYEADRTGTLPRGMMENIIRVKSAKAKRPQSKEIRRGVSRILQQPRMQRC